MVALLALQAPVASDLRTVVATMQNVADAERMGALAVHIATIARRRHPQHAVPEAVSDQFAQMGRLAVDLGNRAGTVVLSGDPRQAVQIRHDDEQMNELHQQLFAVLQDLDWPYGVPAAVDVTCWDGSMNASPTTPSRSGAASSFKQPEQPPKIADQPVRHESHSAIDRESALPGERSRPDKSDQSGARDNRQVLQTDSVLAQGSIYSRAL